MDFFEECISTSMRELGWPKSKGFFRKKFIFSERAIDESMRAAICTALVLGTAMPHIAQSVVIQNVTKVLESSGLRRPTSQQDVFKAIADRTATGNRKLVSEPILNPMWMHFCLVEAGNKEGDVEIFNGIMIPSKQDLLDADDPTLYEILAMAVENAHIALAWAMSNPFDAVLPLFHWEEEQQHGFDFTLDSGMIYTIELAKLRKSSALVESKQGPDEEWDDRNLEWHLGTQRLRDLPEQ